MALYLFPSAAGGPQPWPELRGPSTAPLVQVGPEDGPPAHTELWGLVPGLTTATSQSLSSAAGLPKSGTANASNLGMKEPLKKNKMLTLQKWA